MKSYFCPFFAVFHHSKCARTCVCVCVCECVCVRERERERERDRERGEKSYTVGYSEVTDAVNNPNQFVSHVCMMAQALRC